MPAMKKMSRNNFGPDKALLMEFVLDSLLITRFSRDQRHSLVGNVHTNTYSFVTIALDEESFGEGIAAAAGLVETSSIAEHLLVGAAVAFFPSYGSARGVAGLGIGFSFFFL